MTIRHYVDFAPATTLAAPINSTTNTVLLITLLGYPTAFPYTAVLDNGTGTQELVLVTAASGTVATITRNFDGTGASGHLAGGTFEHVSAAIDFAEANAHTSASSGVHGVVGAVVGTTDTQAISGKTISGSTMASALGVPAVLTSTDIDASHVISVKNVANAEKAFVTGAGAVTATALTVAGVPAIQVVANFAAAPSSPVDGQQMWTSDTKLLWSYNSATSLWMVQSPRQQVYTVGLNNSSSCTTGSGANIATASLTPASVPYPTYLRVTCGALMVVAVSGDVADLVITQNTTVLLAYRANGGASPQRQVGGTFTYGPFAANAAFGAWNWNVLKVTGTGAASVTVDGTRDSLQLTVEPA